MIFISVLVFQKKKKKVFLPISRKFSPSWLGDFRRSQIFEFPGSRFFWKKPQVFRKFFVNFCFNQQKVTLKCVVGGQRVPEHVPRAIQWIDQSRGQTINTFQSGRRVNKKVCYFNELLFNIFITLQIYTVRNLILTPTLAAWPLRSHTALKSILWQTLFLDHLHDFSLLSLNSF